MVNRTDIPYNDSRHLVKDPKVMDMVRIRSRCKADWCIIMDWRMHVESAGGSKDPLI